jgi:hypothetical protein
MRLAPFKTAAPEGCGGVHCNSLNNLHNLHNLHGLYFIFDTAAWPGVPEKEEIILQTWMVLRR